MRAEQAAQLAVGEAPLPCIYEPNLDELVSVWTQRLQDKKTSKLWIWPPAAKEFLDPKDLK